MTYREKLLSIGTVPLCGLVDLDRAEQLAIEADAEIANLRYELGSERTYVQQVQGALNRWLPMVDEDSLGEEATKAAANDAYLLCGLVDFSGREFGKEIVQRKDAEIAGLRADAERIDAQWRDELRIYRETEDARIAELEAEVSRLRVDAERYRWLTSDPIRWEEDYGVSGYILRIDGAKLRGVTIHEAIDAARANGGES